MRSRIKCSAARLPAWACCLGLLTVLATGCGYPAVDPDNMKLISTLRTALSARNETWLQANQDLIEARRDAGAMGDEEFEAFQAIIQRARAGDWAGAEQDSVAFQRAQRPTEAQIRRLREKRL